MKIQTTLNKIKTQTSIPAAFGAFRQKHQPPYVIYRGAGQTNLPADDTFFHSEPDYQIEYYFKEKNEANEAAIESILLEDGWLYEKSSDAFIESESIWVIYYQI